MNPDVVILGAGGAGMMCAIHAATRGRKVLVLDHANKVGGKILISGGGRCNFTNTGATPAQYVSENPHFCKSAMSRYSPADFIKWVEEAGIAYHEKKLGQLFCDESAQQIVELLLTRCRDSGAEIQLGRKVTGVAKTDEGFRVDTDQGPYECASVVVATGGLSIPKIGATGIGYDIARHFGLSLVETAPALDGFTFGSRLPGSSGDAQTRDFRELAGVSIDVVISCNGVSFRENILFTHAGLSGPAALQASLHWRPGDKLELDLSPERSISEFLFQKKREGSRAEMKTLLSELIPRRFAERFCELNFKSELPLAQVPDKALEDLAAKLHHWELIPASTVGYNKAEVTRGGVNTNELSSKTMEARKVPGLFFIGEVVDVTGWLGGYNFQWAWASGWAAGQVV